MYDHKVTRDWMSSHDTHLQGIRHKNADLDYEEKIQPMAGLIVDESIDDVENMIDEARELAKIFVSHLSGKEACACAIIFGKIKKNLKGNFSTQDIEKRLSKLYNEFIYDYPELSVSDSLRVLFSEKVVELCVNMYKNKIEFKGK